MLTVACVWVDANVAYTVEYVRRLQSMTRRWMPVPFRFVCLTDRPKAVDALNIWAIEIDHPHKRAGWWSKLELFNQAHSALTDDVLYLDLDVLLVDSLAPIVNFEHRGLALVPHTGDFNGRQGLRVVKRYNSSVMRFRRDGYTFWIYETFMPSVTRELWGDQDWIGQQYPYQPTMPLEWFPRVSECDKAPRWPEGAKVILCKRPKNHVMLNECGKWFDEAWR